MSRRKREQSGVTKTSFERKALLILTGAPPLGGVSWPPGDVNGDTLADGYLVYNRVGLAHLTLNSVVRPIFH